MKTIIIPGFKGGQANSIFDPIEKQTFQSARDLDIFTSPNILTPHFKLGSITTDPIMNTAKIQAFYYASNGVGYALGNAGDTKLRLYSFAGYGGTETLTTVATSTTNSTAPDSTNIRNIIEYKDYIYFCQSLTAISRFGTLSSGLTYTESWQSGLTALTGAMLSHEGLGLAFFGDKNIVRRWDNSSFSVGLTLAVNWRIVSLAEYGRFVMIGAKDVNNSQNSKIFIWDGSAITVDDIIDLGDVGLQSIRNVNGTIHALTIANPQGTLVSNSVKVYSWSGGQIELSAELDFRPTAGGSPTIPDSAVQVVKNNLYFGVSGGTANTINIDNGIFVFGRGNSREPRILALNRLTATAVHGTPDSDDIYVTSLASFGGIFVVTWNDGTNYFINTLLTSGRKSIDGIYESNAFLLNGGLPGKIKRIVINHKPLVASTGFTVQIKHYGHYPWDGTVPSEDSYVALTTGQGSGTSAGKTQATAGATFTEIKGNELFKEARYAQIKILFDQTSTVNAPEIIFPIIIETT